VFLLFLALVQLAVLLLAHQGADAVVSDAARRSAAGLAVTEESVEVALARMPGVLSADSRVGGDRLVAEVRGSLEFAPPGPRFGTLRIEVVAHAPRVAAP
jgi:hypothetical protein